MNLIAIDVGSGFTKVAKGLGEGARFAIPSIVTPYPEKEVWGLNEDDFIEFNGEKFLTDMSAQNFGMPMKRFDTTNETWHGESWWKALLYKAIAMSFTPKEINGQVLNLATGLPQRIFPERRASLSKILSGEHKFNHGMNEYQFTINPIIIPQAAGALIFNAYKDPDLFDHMVGVIDIGTYTTGLSVIDSLAPVEHRCTGVARGMSDIYKGLADTLKKEYVYSTDPAKMPGIVKSGKALIAGETVDVSSHISDVAKQVSAGIMEKINEVWGNAFDMRVFVTGGGADTFYQSLKEHIPHIKVSLSGEPFYDVVLGMYSYAEGKV